MDNNMQNYNSKFKILTISLFMLLGFFGMVQSSEAANHYVREGASGANNGTDWTNAYTSLPSTLFRDDTYYIATGSYGSYTFDDATDGIKVITIKKATIADHGTDTGWDNTYGNGQAVFNNLVAFTTSYYVIDGNGINTIPSSNTNDYGFKINSNSSTNTGGIVQFSGGSNITLKYIHVYNATNGSINNGTVCLRFTNNSAYIKIQNCFLENSGKDGIQISSSKFVLVERSYIKRLGKLYAESPDYHGQTVQIFYGGDDIIFRWNVWEANEGQGLVQIAARLDGAGTSERIRFYGNVVFVDYNQNPSTPGFNSSGGIFGNAWNYNAVNGAYVYNNTFVNIGPYGGVARFPNIGPYSNWYSYNNLFYNCKSTSYSGWTAYGYHASGGGDTGGGTNEQTGLNSSIFTNYTGNNFTLSSPTVTGLTLTSQSWWQDGSDSFFGQLDYATDMYGNTRGTDGIWDRGAYEYVSGATPYCGDSFCNGTETCSDCPQDCGVCPDITPPAAPVGLTVN